MKTVYVIQESPGKNISGAAKFGRVEVLLPPNQILFETTSYVGILASKLKDFDDSDFLLCIGDPVAIGIATALAARANEGFVNFLKFDRQEFIYNEVRVQLW